MASTVTITDAASGRHHDGRTEFLHQRAFDDHQARKALEFRLTGPRPGALQLFAERAHDPLVREQARSARGGRHAAQGGDFGVE
ncbi:hypothetical protein [Variovorax jilinensis]|uniref:hypothetical protein n=1 Tax=Variovorax jilinensis TaxID=3053513 RepID=UPI002575EA90|nr:hypothetical protein [Variovorax sp. J22P168]